MAQTPAEPHTEAEEGIEAGEVVLGDDELHAADAQLHTDAPVPADGAPVPADEAHEDELVAIFFAALHLYVGAEWE
jgi:hypothetical protein